MGDKPVTVKTGPTKEFFVSIITRDIQLSDAILELIDNSIDGIKRQKATSYKNYFINVTFNKDSFQIEDNCGGIDLETATEYAFVFGKPRAAREKEVHVETTGTFGIGMKRALFKMGDEFEIVSKSKNSSFTLQVDVNKWMQDEAPRWDFPLSKYNDSEKNKAIDCGTKITVKKLFESIAQNFEYNAFINEVITIVQRRTNAEIYKGLNIMINGIKIGGSFLSIITGGGIDPYKYYFESDDIKVMVLAGISPERDPDKAGWYIYCNNREVLTADKSSLTTWKDDKDTEGVKYHNDFATFRGFVFFTSIYPEKLPWNTSKTGIDSSSSIYKTTKTHMDGAFKIFSSELRKLARLDEDTRNAVTNAVRQNRTIEVHYYAAAKIQERTSVAFINDYVEKTKNKQPPLTKISYSVEKDIANKVKRALKVTRNEEVGLRTFNYFVKMEEILDA